jgi:antitoxin VapB
MASLYIKDEETAAIANRVAVLLGTTKTATVKRALRELEAGLTTIRSTPEQTTVEWLHEYRKKHPLPPPTGLKADKAFFDEMWGEDPD